jgi:hypothetical protein
VDQHVEKGNDDGLYISSVACCHELWALIMDAGTGFSAQVGCFSGCGPSSKMSRTSVRVCHGAASDHAGRGHSFLALLLRHLNNLWASRHASQSNMHA